MVDVDPQASLTRNLGFQPDYFIHAEDTLAPFLMYDEEPTETNVAERILKTHIYTLDLLPASLDLQSVEWGLAAAIHSVSYNRDLDESEKDTERAKFFLRLAYCLNSVAQGYDLIVLDGTPTLGVLPLNIVFAAHGLIVPVPTEKVDFASTKSFLDLLSDNIKTLTHLFDDQIDVPQPRFLATKFESGQMSSSSQSVLDDFIKPTFGDHLFNTVIHQHRAAVGAGSYFSRTMFEVNATTLSVKSDARKRCMENYEQAFKEIMDAMVFPIWPTTSKLKALAEEI
jgi:chromosome partitioning protein